MEPIICVMAMPRRTAITDEQLQGFKYFKKFLPLLDRLHDAGCQRDTPGNRTLHFDQYIALQLVFFLNPIVTSMRGLVQASALKKVQRELGVAPTSLGSFSEAGSVFDAELLKPIIAELGEQLKPLNHDPRNTRNPRNKHLDDLPGRLIAVDGTELSALAKLADRMIEGRAIKLHTHFEPLTGVPVDIDLTAAKDSEIENLLRRLLPDRVYVKDRGYACFKLMQAIDDIGSHFVTRVRDNSVYEVIEDRALSDEAKAAGITSDQIVRLGCESKRDELKQPVRILKIACTPHRKPLRGRGRTWRAGAGRLPLDRHQPARSAGGGDRADLPQTLDDRVVLPFLQARAGLPAPAEPSQERHRDSGLHRHHRLHVDRAMDRPAPTLRTVEMIRFYFTGWADIDELEAHIAKLKKLDA
ncbi:MAG: transposase [Rhodobacteraceae bacterium]|nr:transposase [Paracoccaceae bacterium]